MPSVLTTSHAPRLHQATLARGGFIEKRITIAADPRDPLRMFSDVIDAAHSGEWTVCSQVVFGRTAAPR